MAAPCSSASITTAPDERIHRIDGPKLAVASRLWRAVPLASQLGATRPTHLLDYHPDDRVRRGGAGEPCWWRVAPPNRTAAPVEFPSGGSRRRCCRVTARDRRSRRVPERRHSCRFSAS